MKSKSKLRLLGGLFLGTVAAAVTGVLMSPDIKQNRPLQFRLRRTSLVDRLTRCRQELQEFIQLCQTTTKELNAR